MKGTKIDKFREIINDNIYMLGFIKKAAPWFITITIFVSFTAIIDTVASTWLSKIVFDSMANQTPFKFLVIILMFLLLLTLIAAAIRTIFHQKYSPIANQKISGYMRSLIFNKTRQLDLSYYENTEFYDKYTRALAEADERAISVLNSLSQLSYSIITLLTISTVIIILDPILLIFAVLGSVMSALISKKLAKLHYEYDFDKIPHDRKASYIKRVFYEPQYAKDMKMDSMHSYFITFYKNVINDTIHYIKNRTSKIAFWEFLAGTQNLVLQIIMTIFLTWRVYSGIISIGDYAALLNATFLLIFQLQALTALIPKFYEHSLYIKNFKEILNNEPNIEHESGIELGLNEPLSFEFCNVTFSYPDSDTTVLNDINLKFEVGKKYAIVGHNGAGKSTIVKLILRLYDVDSGVILVNGKDIKELNVFSLRQNIANVFQDFQIYSVPMADYIISRHYDENIDKLDVETAIENAGLSEKINSLSNKLMTPLTKEFDENGTTLSGGEVQKLAIAKAIIKKWIGNNNGRAFFCT